MTDRLNIIIPMAGEGSRFKTRGYSFPKPLIQMPDGNPMIKMVIDSLGIYNATWHFIVRSEQQNKYKLGEILPRMVKNLEPRAVYIHPLQELTQGAACTVLTIKDYINNDDQLLIANSDQWIKWNPDNFLCTVNHNDPKKHLPDGAILTFKSFHPKWSFVKLNDIGEVSRVAEKDPISDDATVGIYWWREGSSFVSSAEEMIKLQQTVNGEYYIAPTFNKMIQRGDRIVPYYIEDMQGVGTPEDLNKFETKYYIREALHEFQASQKRSQKEG